MSWFIYSPEELPRVAWMGKPGYTPDPDYLEHSGWRMAHLEANKWVPLPNSYRRFYHRDWTNRAGTTEIVSMDEIAPALNTKFRHRGVIVIDHEPSKEERTKLEREAEDTNLAWRMSIIENYEERLKQRAVGEKVNVKPTMYENECYDLLKITKPHSVEAMRAQRHPGEAVGEQIVAALERLAVRREEAQIEQANTPAKPVPARA